MQERWRAHLCGLCLTLRDEAGQAARVLTGYDALLLSVLVEAQAGTLPTSRAGRCPLRGMRTAEVVRADLPAAQLAAAASLLTGAAGLRDKVADSDLPVGTRTLAGAAGSRYERQGVALARRVRLDPASVLGATAAAHEAESRTPSSLDDLLAPTGAVVAALFAYTAVVAGVFGNAAALARVGDGFGRLVHLLDAVDDQAADDRRRAFNPLTATGTTRAEAHRLAQSLVRDIADALDDVVLVEPALARLLLGRELDQAVRRAFPASGLAPVVAVSGLTSLLLCDNTRRAHRLRRDAKQRRSEGGTGEDSGWDFCCDPCCDPCGCCNACDCGGCDCGACADCGCGDCCGACDCSC